LPAGFDPSVLDFESAGRLNPKRIAFVQTAGDNPDRERAPVGQRAVSWPTPFPGKVVV